MANHTDTGGDTTAADAGDSPTAGERTDHGGIIDIRRFPGGAQVTAIRVELTEMYQGYLGLDTDDKEPLRRWGIGSILSHWVMVLTMVIAIVTGVAFWTGWYGPMNVGIWDGYQVAFDLHILSGVVLAVLALVVFPFYHKVVDGHKLLVSRKQLKENIIIALAFVGLVRYIPGYKQARRTYDEDRHEWVGYHPMQTVFWYVTWFFVLALTLTGFALWHALATDPAWWVTVLGFMEGWTTYETMLRLHLLATFWVIAAIAIHAYFAITPDNWDILRSIVGGRLDGWRIDEQKRSEIERDEPNTRTDERNDE